jgi:hypothetical protein
MPRESVRFVHEAKTDTDLARLFAACRSGHVAVLVGSTEKMGVGTNVQDRAIALHHLDAPWRPADVDQREGRIIRQGNLNPEVQVIRWITARSFDGYMWQTLERKAKFIREVMSPALDAREIADIGDQALSYSEAKALAAGNPLLIDKAEADTELARLTRVERAHHRDQDTLRRAITRHQQHIAARTTLVGDIDTAIARRKDTRGDLFTMTVEGQEYRKRADAGQHVLPLLTREATNQLGFRHRTLHIGELGGFPLTATVSRPLGQTQVTLTLDGAPGSDLTLTIADLAETDPVGLVTRLENRLTRLEATKAQALADIDHASTEITHAHTDLGKPFAYADEFTAARERCRDIDEQLEAAATPPQPQNAEAGRNDPPMQRQESPVASQRIGHPATVRAADEPDIRPSWPLPTNYQAGHTRGRQPDPDASAGHRPVCRRSGLPLPQYGDAEPWRRSAPGNDHHAQDREAGQ